ncbi:MAG TPA: 3'(2'),5'-bisphosphate nucleotidase CysQ [Saprospiraceae bacterium]|nr:3'(2'),5'-bisphosphate nucleotidase CysQ [Saprospiraceae bacterium]
METMHQNILPILKKAGAAIMEVYADESKFNIELKSDNSPLTDADKQSNEIIIQYLSKHYPDIPIISEETKEASYAERKNYERYFLIDPLDGTKEFIKRNGEFTINVAYLEDSSPVCGYVYVPVNGNTYYAARGRGAFKIDNDSSVIELRSKPFFLFDPNIKVVASRSHPDEQTERIISLLQNPEVVSAGSALKFMLIAAGLAHFYPRLAPTMEWDTAAAQCILEEAGGSVIRFDDLMPLTYNKENLLNTHFIAMGSLLDPESLKKIL